MIMHVLVTLKTDFGLSSLLFGYDVLHVKVCIAPFGRCQFLYYFLSQDFLPLNAISNMNHSWLHLGKDVIKYILKDLLSINFVEICCLLQERNQSS